MNNITLEKMLYRIIKVYSRLNKIIFINYQNKIVTQSIDSELTANFKN